MKTSSQLHRSTLFGWLSIDHRFTVKNLQQTSSITQRAARAKTRSRSEVSFLDKLCIDNATIPWRIALGKSNLNHVLQTVNNMPALDAGQKHPKDGSYFIKTRTVISVLHDVKPTRRMHVAAHHPQKCKYIQLTNTPYFFPLCTH